MADQRRAYSRIPIPNDQAETVLRFGAREVEVRLINASPFGFAIACPASLKTECGDYLRILTNSGWCEVEVVHIEPHGPDILLGVARVRDLGASPDSKWLVSLGGREGALLLPLVLSIGLLVGALFVSKSEWTQKLTQSIRSAVAQLRW